MHNRWIIAAMAGAAAVACSSSKDKGSSIDVSLTITSDPAGKTPVTKLPADGDSRAIVTVNTGSYDGIVSLTTSQGYLTEGLVPDTARNNTVSLSTLHGTAIAVLRTCNHATESSCGGIATLTAQAGADSYGQDSVEFTCAGGPCEGTGGAGGDGGGGNGGGGNGGGGSGGSAGTGGTPNYTIGIKSSRDLVRNEFETTTITATVLKDGKPAPTATGPMTFSVETTAALVGLGTDPLPTAVAPANQKPVALNVAQGVATINLTGRGVGQTATVHASFGNATNSIDIGLDPGPDLKEIAAVTVKPDTVGVRESLKSSISTITFQLLDEVGGTAAPGLPVNFSVQGDVNAQVEPVSETTDATGTVTVKFTAGGVRIPNTIVALAKNREAGDVKGTAVVTVVNGSPSQRGFDFACPLDQYFPSGICIDDEVKCDINLSDRDGGTADASWPVSVQSEAGKIVGQSFVTDNKGHIQITHGTGSPTPDQVAVHGEGKSLAMVTLLAYTKGEEEFSDCSPDNHYYDAPNQGDAVCTACGGTSCSGEPFTDLSEPLMDNNDNGVFDDGEIYVEIRGPDKGGTNGFDLGNGVWDKDTTIWKTTHVLWIDAFGKFEFYSPPGATNTDASTLPACTDLHLRIVDKNGNCMNPHDTGKVALAISTSGAQGTFNYPNNTLKVGNCFDMNPVGDWTRTTVDGQPDPEFGPQDYPVSFLLTPPAPPKTPPPYVTLKATLTYKHACLAQDTQIATVDCRP